MPIPPITPSDVDPEAGESQLERRLRVQREMEERAAQYRLYLRTSASGLEFGLSVVVGVLAGYFIDRWLDSAPVGLLVGLGFGMAAGIRTLVRMARKTLAEGDDEDSADAHDASDEEGAHERRR